MLKVLVELRLLPARLIRIQPLKMDLLIISAPQKLTHNHSYRIQLSPLIKWEILDQFSL